MVDSSVDPVIEPPRCIPFSLQKKFEMRVLSCSHLIFHSGDTISLVYHSECGVLAKYLARAYLRISPGSRRRDQDYKTTSLYGGLTPAKHDENLQLVLQKCREASLKLNQEKCELRLNELKFVEHIFSADGV